MPAPLALVAAAVLPSVIGGISNFFHTKKLEKMSKESQAQFMQTMGPMLQQGQQQLSIVQAQAFGSMGGGGFPGGMFG